MKRHPLYSFELLGDDISEDVRYAVRWHHEKLDGKGYPDGLKAESISYFARITTISDIYDAMLSARSYKKRRFRLSTAMVCNPRAAKELTRIFSIYLSKIW